MAKFLTYDPNDQLAHLRRMLDTGDYAVVGMEMAVHGDSRFSSRRDPTANRLDSHSPMP